MAIFNFGGQSVDSTDSEGLIQAAQDAGVSFGGSIVLGSVYGVSGGEHHGDVHSTEQQD